MSAKWEELTNAQKSIALLRATKREGINYLCEWMLSTDWAIAPASTYHHGSYSGGLVDHSCDVFAAFMLRWSTLKELLEPNFGYDSVVISTLLHDVCKINTYEIEYKNRKDDNGNWHKVEGWRRNPKFKMGHAAKSVGIIQQYIKLTPDEMLAIYWHMGGYDLSMYSSGNEQSGAFHDCMLAYLVHSADMDSCYLFNATPLSGQTVFDSVCNVSRGELSISEYFQLTD